MDGLINNEYDDLENIQYLDITDEQSKVLRTILITENFNITNEEEDVIINVINTGHYNNYERLILKNIRKAYIEFLKENNLKVKK